MKERGVSLRLYSLWGGGGSFEGLPVESFNKWRLFALLWVIPWVALTRWDVFGILLRGLLTRRPPSWLNFWENMLGAGFAGLHYRAWRQQPPDWIHAAWAGGPATAAWCLTRLNGGGYSSGAHAYDLYEHGGDWWLEEKLAEARFIHTSTEMGRDTMLARGVSAERIHVIRRGLVRWPECRPVRAQIDTVRIVCICRLVAKKGLPQQVRIYQALQAAGVPFTARIIGDGPEREKLARALRAAGLEERIELTGHLAQAEVWSQLAWADVLVHTGIVAPSGDRDGLPNVIPEAMAAGVLVVTSPAAATTEAIVAGRTGWVAPVEKPELWVEAMREVMASAESRQQRQQAARAWVETHYDAKRNAEVLHGLFQAALKESRQ